MPESIRCPDCGHDNPADSVSCEACNFPLATHEEPAGEKAPAPAAAAEPIRIPRPVRRQRPRPRANTMSMSMWLLFGTIAALVLVWTAYTSSQKSNAPAVEGSSADQQRLASEAMAALARDTSNVDAHIALANVLYDTANWSEAIVHYRAAVAKDSSRVPAIVDLGVCYYNLGDVDAAERHFQLAIVRDPHQPVALFNLGIVNQRRERYEVALEYFHRALQSNPPEAMQQAINAQMQEVLARTGRRPPPLSEGKAPGTP